MILEQDSINGQGARGTRMPKYPISGYLPGSKLAVVHPGMLMIPGETMTDLRIRMQGRTLGVRRDLEPMYRDIWVWFTPMRLMWDGWADWMTSGGDGAGLPGRQGNNPWLGDGLQGTSSKRANWNFKAYELIASHSLYNPPYLGGELGHSAMPAGVAALKTLPAPDVLSEIGIYGEEEVADVSVTLDVDNSDSRNPVVSLSLEKLRELGMIAAQTQLEAEGHLHALSPYEQLLKLYGVELEQGATLIDEPELWHHSRTMVWPERFTELFQRKRDHRVARVRIVDIQGHGHICNFLFPVDADLR